VTYLAQARALGASLVAAANTDASVRRLGKGEDRPLQERAKNRLLREQIAELMAEIVKLASVNEAVLAELSLLKSMADRKVVRLSAGSGR
jgi:bifunctional ADP-heptose synthase (sugar kinase/adenylyltransferase)